MKILLPAIAGIFISHYVQIKPRRGGVRGNIKEYFISHYVQIKQSGCSKET